MKINVDKIKNFMNKYGIKQYGLCSLCNLTRQSIKNILTNSANVKIYELNKIAELMEIDIVELFENEN